MKRTVFISHSSIDKAIAEQVCRFLETHGIRCWVAPRDVTPGKNYGAAILDAIDECSVFVLILTSESNKSGQVVREVERAASSNAVIIPFRVEEVQPSRNLEFYVSSAHWLDAISKPLEKHLRELLKAIRNWQQGDKDEEKTGPPPPVSPPPPLAPASPRWSLPFSLLVAAGAGGAILLCLLVGYAVLGHKTNRFSGVSVAPTPAASSPAPSEIPSPTPSPVSPTPEITPPPASPTASIPHRRPGELLRSQAPVETPSPPTPTAPQSAVRLRPGQPLASASPAASAAPTASMPVVREVVASSELHVKKEVRKASFAFDGDLSTAWVPEGDGVNQSLTAHFKAPVTISSVSVVSAAGNDTQFHVRNRVHTMRVILSDGTNQVITLADKTKWQRFELTRPVATDWVKIDILTIYPGTKLRHTPIVEIGFNRPD